jgi:hypothetical protein
VSLRGQFTVATIAREPWPVLQRFLRWHLAQGAERIILYLDDPTDPALPRLTGEPRIDPRPCTDAFWAARGMDRTTRFTRRQRQVLSEAYAETPDGWLLVLDADELMWFRDRSIPETLAALPDAALSLRVQSAEQVHLPDGTDGFRTPIPRKSVNHVYGPDAELLRIRHGLVYHAEGKSFHRAGQTDLTMKLHWAEDATGAHTPGPVIGAQEKAHLIHYAAPDYARWRAKVDWRVGAHGFAKPIKARVHDIAASADPEAGYRALFERLHSLTEAQADALEAKGGLLRQSPPLPQD